MVLSSVVACGVALVSVDASWAIAGVATTKASALDAVAASNPCRACRTKTERSEKPAINSSLPVIRPSFPVRQFITLESLSRHPGPALVIGRAKLESVTERSCPL
jgi:hypothetical protein